MWCARSNGAVAQLGEHLAGSQKVRGSSPRSSTILLLIFRIGGRYEKAIVQDRSSGQRVLVGPKRFLENLQLIDLSLCPYLLDNLEYVLGKQFKPVKFDLKAVRNLISKYKLRGVTADIPRYISPFKKLVRESNAS